MLSKYSMDYGYRVRLHMSFDVVLVQVRTALASEGFGILTEIDVQATMKAKLGVDGDRYTILGACNPELAHHALAAEKEVGLLLPCNVIVYEDGADVVVSAVDPTIAMAMIENPVLQSIAETAAQKLRSVIHVLT
jgi:uncharacterized protein (DUF302 family)